MENYIERRRMAKRNAKVYIIGSIPFEISTRCIKDIYATQMLLENRGFEVINPLNAILANKGSLREAMFINLKCLMACNSVYIMPDVSLKKGECSELKIAIELNLLVYQGMYHTEI